MLYSDYATQNCSVARALEAVGERWTLLIIRELLRGPRRFSQLERDLQVSKNVLASRLEKLIVFGIADKPMGSDERPASRYELTPKGRDLFPVITALMAWGDAYEAPDGPPAVFVHSCGQPAGHHLVCDHCGDTVDVDTITVEAGPGLHC